VFVYKDELKQEKKKKKRKRGWAHGSQSVERCVVGTLNQCGWMIGAILRLTNTEYHKMGRREERERVSEMKE
jgi:hypothetical protein